MGMMNLPLLILNTLDGAEYQVGIAYSVAPVFELPFLVYLGILATRVDHARMIRAALILAIVYYGLLARVEAPWQVYGLQVLSAAIVAVTSGVAITFFQNFLPEQAGTATNLYSNATRLGATGGYLLFGYVVAEGGHRTVFAVCALFCGLALSLLLAFRAKLNE
jgi:SET family sugar efflux transporter-like MFS transporter